MRKKRKNLSKWKERIQNTRNWILKKLISLFMGRSLQKELLKAAYFDYVLLRKPVNLVMTKYKLSPPSRFKNAILELHDKVLFLKFSRDWIASIASDILDDEGNFSKYPEGWNKPIIGRHSTVVFKDDLIDVVKKREGKKEIKKVTSLKENSPPQQAQQKEFPSPDDSGI